MSKTITISDVAKQTGVSKTTISRIINGKPDVAPETKERVLKCIEQMGFVPSELARSLSKGQSHLVGILVPSLTDQWTLEFLHGVSEIVERSPYNLVLFSLGAPEAVQVFFENTLPMGLISGLILVLPFPEIPQINQLLVGNFPVILVDDRGTFPEFNRISVTNRLGAYEATKHLIHLGHSRIGYISGPLTILYFQERLAGYQDALAEAGILPEEGLVVECEATKTAAIEIVRHWLENTPPSAIFTSIDMLAYGALEALTSRGIRVPEDIALVGFDDLPGSEHVQPPLTTVKEPILLMGQTAARMLLEWLDTGELKRNHVELPTELIIRASSGTELG